MSRQDFVDQLRSLKYDVTVISEEFISFPYRIPVGKHIGEEVELGFYIASDFPATPPATGPHIKPQILPVSPGGQPPTGGVNPSQYPDIFDDKWQYWSRPYNNWNNGNAKMYMAFIRRLFEDLP